MLATPMLKASVSGSGGELMRGWQATLIFSLDGAWKPTPRQGSSVEVAATRCHDTKGLADSFQEYRTFQKGARRSYLPEPFDNFIQTFYLCARWNELPLNGVSFILLFFFFFFHLLIGQQRYDRKVWKALKRERERDEVPYRRSVLIIFSRQT